MGRAPAGGVEIAWVEPLDLEDVGQGADHALFDEFSQPGQVHGNQVIAAFRPGGVAQRLFAQPVDGKGALADIRPHDLFELALEVFHDHEGRVAMHEDAQPAGQLQRMGQGARRRDGGLSGLIGPAEIVFAGRPAARIVRERVARHAVDPVGDLVEHFEQARAGVQRKALA